MKKLLLIGLFSIAGLSFSAALVSCTDSRDSQSNLREETEDLYDDAKQEVCETVNGKLECTYKKVVDDAKDMVD